jgi:integrase
MVEHNLARVMSNLNIYEEYCKKQDLLSKKDIKNIVKAIQSNYDHLLWFKMIYSFGLNLNEFVNLKVRDINLKTLHLQVNKHKRLQNRTLNIPKDLSNELRIQCCHKEPNDFLFNGRNGKLHERTIQKVFSKASKILNQKITIQKIRKSLILHFIEEGWNIDLITRFIGHSSSKLIRKEYSKMKKFLNPKNEKLFYSKDFKLQPKDINRASS